MNIIILFISIILLFESYHSLYLLVPTGFGEIELGQHLCIISVLFVKFNVGTQPVFLVRLLI